MERSSFTVNLPMLSVALHYIMSPAAHGWDNSDCTHFRDVIMGTMASEITSLAIVYSGAYQRKHQSSVSRAFVWGIHRGPVNSPHKWPVTRKMFPFDDVIMLLILVKSLQRVTFDIDISRVYDTNIWNSSSSESQWLDLINEFHRCGRS